MKNANQNNTNVTIVGEVVRNGVFAYEKDGENFYEILIKVTGVHTAVLGETTVLPVTISERALENARVRQGTRVFAVAYLYSRTQKGEDGRSHFRFELQAQSLLPYEESEDQVIASFCGYLCKPLQVKTSDDGKTETHALFCVNRDGRVSDYFPVLCTESMAQCLETISIGNTVFAIGVLKGFPSEEGKAQENFQIIMTNCVKIPKERSE